MIINKILFHLHKGYLRRVSEYKMTLIIKNKNVKISDGFKFNFEKNNFEVYPRCIVDFDKDVLFRDYCNVLVHSGAKLILGKNVFFNRYCSINCLGTIKVGDYTIFGEGVKLYDHNHKYNNIDKIIQEDGCNIGKIEIGRNCWIGANVTILNNVLIGDNVVIGANNLIYKNIPSGVVVKSKAEQILTIR